MRIELTNLFLDQAAFEAVPLANAVALPYDTQYTVTYQAQVG